MLVLGLPAAAFATNCYVVAPDAGAECVVVDPGIGVLDRLGEALRAHRLKPQAVLLTHGHLDHVFSVTPVCAAEGVPALVHGADCYRLRDPLGSLGGDLRQMLAQQFGRLAWSEPDDVRPLTDGQRLDVAGLALSVDHAPGHTEGSVLFRLPSGEPDGHELCVAGDVLFAGSIGRTDLPGGDHAAMLRSLATKVLPLRDDTLVLPGHGPVTTIGAERATNPFLAGLASPA